MLTERSICARTLTTMALAMLLACTNAQSDEGDTCAAGKCWEFHHDDIDAGLRIRTAIANSPMTIGDPYSESGLSVGCIKFGNSSFLKVGLLSYLQLTPLRPSRHREAAGGGSESLNTIVAEVDDGEPEKHLVWQSGNQLAFERPEQWAAVLANADKFAVRLHYQGHGDVTIRYNMNGSKAAIDKVIASCIETQ